MKKTKSNTAAAVTPEVQPQPAPTPEPTPVAAVVGNTKQQAAIAKWVEAVKARGVELPEAEKLMTQDGKNINLNVGPTWPTIVVGFGGGFNLPQVKSYLDSFEAAVNGDTFWAKQTARDAKKLEPKAPVAAKPEEKKEAGKETVTERKAGEHEKLEQQLQA